MCLSDSHPATDTRINPPNSGHPSNSCDPHNKETKMTRKEEGTSSNEEDFDSVFAEITKPNATDTATDEGATPSGDEGDEASGQRNEGEGADDTPNPSGEGDETGTSGDGDGNASEGEEGAAQQKPESKPAAKAGDDEDPAVWRQRYLTLQGKFNKLASQRQPQQHQQQDDDGNSAEQDTGKKQQPDPAQQLAEEDRELLEQLDSELPLVGKAVRKLLETQQKSLLSVLEQKLAPVARTVQLTEEDKHFAAIYEAHEDFDDIVAGEELYEWIDSHPSYIQSGMRAVLDRGTSGEVIDLFSRFKEASGKAGAQQQEDRQQQEDPAVARRKKQLEDAGAVRSRTPAAPSTKGAAPDDFDGAFEAAAASRTRK